MRLTIWLVTIFLLINCTSAPASQIIHLSNLQPLPPSNDTQVEPLRIAIAAIISPQGTIINYQPLLDYISSELDRPIELVQRQTYAEVNSLLEDELVDLAFVCTTAYILGQRDFNMELLVAPQVNGKTVYYSLIIVPAESPAHTFADLERHTFAFTDPLSTSGRLYPTYLVQEHGSTPDEFFSQTFFTYSHDNAIKAVAGGITDGAAVDSLVYDFAVNRESHLAKQIRVIHRSQAFGAPPVVVHPNIRPKLRATLQNLFLQLTSRWEGRRALRAIGVDQFVIVDDRHYDTVRDLNSAVEIKSDE